MIFIYFGIKNLWFDSWQGLMFWRDFLPEGYQKVNRVERTVGETFPTLCTWSEQLYPWDQAGNKFIYGTGWPRFMQSQVTLTKFNFLVILASFISDATREAMIMKKLFLLFLSKLYYYRVGKNRFKKVSLQNMYVPMWMSKALENPENGHFPTLDRRKVDASVICDLVID